MINNYIQLSKQINENYKQIKILQEYDDYIIIKKPIITEYNETYKKVNKDKKILFDDLKKTLKSSDFKEGMIVEIKKSGKLVKAKVAKMSKKSSKKIKVIFDDGTSKSVDITKLIVKE